MQGFIRKVRTGVLVFLLVVGGGGFASALGNDPAETFHTVTYEVLSFRAISLSSADAVAIGDVRQGSQVAVDGPKLLYATTWAGDKITADLSSNVAGDLILYVSASTPHVSSAVECDEGGIGTPAGSVILDEDGKDLITAISDCGLDSFGSGLDSFGKWVWSPLRFRLDATAASADVDYTGAQTKTVTYTIDSGI